MAQKLNFETKTLIMKQLMGSINIGKSWIYKLQVTRIYPNVPFHKQGQLVFQFLPVFFILVWLDEFGKTCGRFDSQNVEDHITKCLGQYYNLQKGLGKYNL